jgi:hypothetical protein
MSPPPGLPQAPIVTTDDLRVGDVVQIAVSMEDRLTGRSYWWKRFAVVMRIHGSNRFSALNLKMAPDLDRDYQRCSLSADHRGRAQVVTLLPQPWPQGVAAMYMRLVALKVIEPV